MGFFGFVDGIIDCEFFVSGGGFDGKWNDRNCVEFIWIWIGK